ncbi:MAG: serine protease [Bacilli bacterium]|nr:serine protease [Bacilli bacterium]
MFIKSIEKALRYTKPFITGKVLYENREILNDINTLIVLNKNGDILTTARVADAFLAADDINEVFTEILNEMKLSNKKGITKIERKYDVTPKTIIKLHNILIDVAENPGKLTIIKHSYLDLAIIKLENTENVFVNNFPVFKTGIKKIGTSICNLGYAFPEYDAFKYNIEKEKINITNKTMNFPIFPSSGIITRNIADQNKEITMFETSVPALPGQNGGPVIDIDGNILGILIGTKRIATNFTNDMLLNLDLGLAVDSNAIVNFLEKNQIKYNKIN